MAGTIHSITQTVGRARKDPCHHPTSTIFREDWRFRVLRQILLV